ncbi:MAG TPA: AtpZ/AtpI family protein [Stellaceae bacterium]|nr:AtpZ/AtpI family protein [Stellaceae bacterium]
MSEQTPPDPLARLGEKIEQARREQLRREGHGDAAQGPIGVAWRVAAELVAAFAVGVGLGLGFDYLFGTRPWGLIAGVFLGGAAGILSAYRAANELGRSPPPGPQQDRGERD